MHDALIGTLIVQTADRLITVRELHRLVEAGTHIELATRSASSSKPRFAPVLQVNRSESQVTALRFGKTAPIQVAAGQRVLGRNGWLRADQIKVGDQIVGALPGEFETVSLAITSERIVRTYSIKAARGHQLIVFGAGADRGIIVHDATP